MSRKYRSYLDRQMLESWGITAVYKENSSWIIKRYWYKNCGKQKVEKTISVTDAKTKRKYTAGKTYPKVQFSVKSKGIPLTLSRLVYAWYIGPIAAELDVEHIDNDPYNCDPENLRLCTREENLRKRYLDNANGFNRNQYEAKQDKWGLKADKSK